MNPVRILFFTNFVLFVAVVAVLPTLDAAGDEVTPAQEADVAERAPKILNEVNFGALSSKAKADDSTPKEGTGEISVPLVEEERERVEVATGLSDQGATKSSMSPTRIQPVLPPKGLDSVTPPDYASSQDPSTTKTARSEKPATPRLLPQPERRPLSREMQERKRRIKNALAIYSAQRVSNTKRSPWGLMHAMIPFGAEAMIGINGRSGNAVSWLCANGNGRDLRLFYTKNGQIGIRVGPGLQGHEGQFLAMMAQSRISRAMPITVGKSKFSIEDIVRYEMASCRDSEELTFKLIGLVHYLPSDHQWKNDRGQTFDIQRLIREELKQPVNGAACGGTHRLMGYSYAVNKRRARGEPMTGQWKAAETYVNRYLSYTQGRLRNSDGSYSTNWFEGRGMDRDLDRRVQTTGHMLEWVVYSLPYERLLDQDVTTSIDYLTNLLMRRRNEELEVGPRGHAIRALVLYDERVFNNPPASSTPKRETKVLAKQPKKKTDVDSDLR